MLAGSLVMLMELLTVPMEGQESMPGVPKPVTSYPQWQVILRDAGLCVGMEGWLKARYHDAPQ